MDSSKVDAFLIPNMDKFPPESLMYVKQQLEKIDDNKLYSLQVAEYKDPTTILILSVLTGYFGVDRFILGEVGLGLLKLFTCGGMGIWYIIDIFYAKEFTRKSNYTLFLKKLSFAI